MQIRKLVITDAPTYRSIMLKAYEAHPNAFTSSVSERAAKPLTWWESRLNSNSTSNELVYGAQVGPMLVGVAGISFATREKLRHKATVFGMYVAPESRGTGVGTQLLNAVINEARKRAHVRVIQLTVTQGNIAAQSLYRDRGFQVFGLEPFAVQVGNDFVCKEHMWCNLEESPN